MLRRWSLIAAASILLAPVSAAASLDVAGLYLRKVKLGERTFFQEDGWAQWRNTWDFFYETEWIPGIGDFDPRFGVPVGGNLEEGSSTAFAAWSVGALVLLTRPRSDLQLTFFSLVTGTQRAHISTDTGLILTSSVLGTLAVPFIPQAFTVDGSNTITQHITGFQLRYGDFVEATYGLLTDERFGRTVYRNFIETNVPLLFLSSNLVTAPGADRLERLLVSFRYDQATWMTEASIGLARMEVNQRRTFVVAEIDQLAGVLSGGLRLNLEEGFAEGRLGVRLTTHRHGSARRNGKFGFAYDFKLMASAVDVQKANLWSGDLGGEGLALGGQAELYIQFPSILLLAFLAAASAADSKDETDRRRGLETAAALADLASEDDQVYAGLTLGVSYNDAEVLREVPVARDALHLYLRLRLFY